MTKNALPWTTELLELKNIAEAESGETYNSCLLNLYHHGGEGMAWHSDGEKDLQKDGAICSLSFGAERKFAFKHKKDRGGSVHIFGAWQPACHERHNPNPLVTPVATDENGSNA